jgi:hypothetical protein
VQITRLNSCIEQAHEENERAKSCHRKASISSKKLQSQKPAATPQKRATVELSVIKPKASDSAVKNSDDNKPTIT